jgi:ABC-type dipeptide/oligopeptide/nickel transport system permease component
VLEKLSEPYVVAARARGLSQGQAAFRHALPNAALPLVTLGTVQLGALLSGSVIAERLFERPGLGSLLIEAFAARDLPVVQGCALVVAITYVVVNLFGELVVAAADPRVRQT